MHEEKIALVDGQVKAVQQAVAARAVENVYFVACGGSLATLYPGKYILERETAAVSTGAYTAVLFSECFQFPRSHTRTRIFRQKSASAT